MYNDIVCDLVVTSSKVTPQLPAFYEPDGTIYMGFSQGS